jgi:hypothetical protein
MVAKKPQDRPSWPEILGVLADSGQPENSSPAMNRVVALAVERTNKLEQKRLQTMQIADSASERAELYKHVCGELFEMFDRVVREFNKGFQLGKIAVREFHPPGILTPSRRYHIPDDGTIDCAFFEPRTSGIRIQGRELIGGGFIGLSFGPSANLLLLKGSADDLYGSWPVCSVEVSALVDGSKLIGRYGLTRDTVIPFGFHDQSDFYDQIRYAGGGMHVFIYRLSHDPEAFFLELVEKALAHDPSAKD